MSTPVIDAARVIDAVIGFGQRRRPARRISITAVASASAVAARPRAGCRPSHRV
jgi:S1-C subfamily serine protease